MRIIIRVVAIIAICFIANSNLNAQKVVVTPEQIPTDFKDYQDTLLVIDFNVVLGYKKFLHKNFAEHYSGPYRFATRAEYVKGKLRHYRFVFEAAWDYDAFDKKRIYYTLIDNKKGMGYKTMSTKYYSELMIAYLQRLDAELKKNHNTRL